MKTMNDITIFEYVGLLKAYKDKKQSRIILEKELIELEKRIQFMHIDFEKNQERLKKDSEEVGSKVQNELLAKELKRFEESLSQAEASYKDNFKVSQALKDEIITFKQSNTLFNEMNIKQIMQFKKVVFSYLPKSFVQFRINCAKNKGTSHLENVRTSSRYLLRTENQFGVFWKNTRKTTRFLKKAIKYILWPFKNAKFNIGYLVIVGYLIANGPLASIIPAVFLGLLGLSAITFSYYLIVLPSIALFQLEMMKDALAFLDSHDQEHRRQKQQIEERIDIEKRQYNALFEKSDTFTQLEKNHQNAVVAIKHKQHESLWSDLTEKSQVMKKALEEEQQKLKIILQKLNETDEAIRKGSGLLTELSNETELEKPAKYEFTMETFSPLVITNQTNKEGWIDFEYAPVAKKPIVYLYEDPLYNIDKEDVLFPILIEKLRHISLSFDFTITNSKIVDTVRGAPEFLAPKWKKIVRVIARSEEFLEDWESFKKKKALIDNSVSQSIEEINKQKYKLGDPLLNIDIYHIIIPPDSGKKNFLRLPTQFTNVCHNGYQYGVLPIFYINRQDWEKFLRGEKIDPSLMEMMKTVQEISPSENIIELKFRSEENER